MTRDPLLVRALLVCYPAGWRRRYGDEYAALLADTLMPLGWPRRLASVVNILRGALDARLTYRSPMMTTRSPTSTAIWATGLFTVAGIGFQRLTEDPGIAIATHRSHAISASFTALVVAATVAVAAVVIAAVPAATAIGRGRVKGTIKLLLIPPLAFAAWYVIVLLARHVADGHSVHSATNVLCALLIFAGGVGVVAATAWAASATLRRAPSAPPRLQTVTASVLVAGMAVTTLTCVAWGLSVRAARTPAGVLSHDGILATPLVPSWLTVVALMIGATALAGIATRRQMVPGT